ncbi:hypothetical protein LUZ62_027543 [Rhynchospora pubera]|uniref:ETO1-like protein 1 n=1 Tax=Rhynchospora pubera TaxID=906938 RepID=A0AAV8HG80_9POAL|nr:hypothetical protein LUZ62_027543 [Rhynchospora pubera]
MRKLFFSELSCRETKLQSVNFYSWFQFDKGKLSSKPSLQSPSSIETLIKVAEPLLLPQFKPTDYVEILAQIHEELETCKPDQKSNLFLLQFQVFRGLGESKLSLRSLQLAWEKSTSIHEKLIYDAWLKYEKKGEEPISDLLSSCHKCCQKFNLLDYVSQLSTESITEETNYPLQGSNMVYFKIGDDMVACDRRKIAALSSPLHTMLNGGFKESKLEVVDMSSNGISPLAMRAVSKFSLTGKLPHFAPEVLLEILDFSNKYCCKCLKEACDRKLATFVHTRQDAVDYMECALELGCTILAAACLNVLLDELPAWLNEEHVVNLFSNMNKAHLSTLVGNASFSLFCFLSEVAMSVDPKSETTVLFLEKLVESATENRQNQFALHQLGCVKFLRKEYVEAEDLFNLAFSAGHVYSIAGLARIASFRGNKHLSIKMLDSVISSCQMPLGWMYQERSLYTEGDAKWESLNRATESDPTLVYPYMYRAAYLMKKQSIEAALVEINRVLGFKLSLECLEMRFCLHIALEDYRGALRDIHAMITLDPEWRMFEGRVLVGQMKVLVMEHVERWTAGDCWMHLYDRWSAVDDIGSLSVICQMLESDLPKGVLYFRQSLLLLRLNCPEAAMRSLALAREHASSKHERLVYEGWILYDTGHCEEGLRKAEESIAIHRSFEAFFLKAYALADSGPDPPSPAAVVSLLEEALKCASDRLRKGQALNNLGSVYVDCGKLDQAAECYSNALKIGHTRAHQGLARVHFLRNDRNKAYEEMTKLVEKARNNASAYEKRSEYCERDLTRADLHMVTKLDPLRVYPYRYRAAVLMDNHKEKEAIAELSHAIAFKADLHLLHLRAAFHEHIGNVSAALRDCRAALSVDPTHQEMLELHTRVHTQEP